eukprot:9757634-Ditylum_brightwellii.AAC.1
MAGVQEFMAKQMELLKNYTTKQFSCTSAYDQRIFDPGGGITYFMQLQLLQQQLCDFAKSTVDLADNIYQ